MHLTQTLQATFGGEALLIRRLRLPYLLKYIEKDQMGG